ncbi:hypothetical protein Ancab_028192, partial [Ancistrocladus abbreviatus]
MGVTSGNFVIKATYEFFLGKGVLAYWYATIWMKFCGSCGGCTDGLAWATKWRWEHGKKRLMRSREEFGNWVRIMRVTSGNFVIKATYEFLLGRGVLAYWYAAIWMKFCGRCGGCTNVLAWASRLRWELGEVTTRGQKVIEKKGWGDIVEVDGAYGIHVHTWTTRDERWMVMRHTNYDDLRKMSLSLLEALATAIDNGKDWKLPHAHEGSGQIGNFLTHKAEGRERREIFSSTRLRKEIHYPRAKGEKSRKMYYLDSRYLVLPFVATILRAVSGRWSTTPAALSNSDGPGAGGMDLNTIMYMMLFAILLLVFLLTSVQCSPEEIHSAIHRASSEKGDHRSGDIHAILKEGGPSLPKFSRVASSQDKIACSEPVRDQQVQRVSQGKAEHRETVESSRCAGEQAFQKQDGSSGDTLYTSNREGKEYRATSIGPTPVGPANTKEGIVLTRGALAHSTREPSAHGVSAPRENTSKMQQLSEI